MSRQIIDLTGKTFNYLTVIERADDYIQSNGKKEPAWLCKCICGNKKVIKGSDLKTGNIKSCGCMHYVRKYEDLTGQRFGRLVVIERAEDKIYSGQKFISWLCQCDCGNTTIAQTGNLKNGRVSSCGCYKKEEIQKRCKIYNDFDLTTEEYGICRCMHDDYFIFDKEDYDKIKNYTWRKNDSGYYIGRKLNDTTGYRVHRVILNVTDPKLDVDHIGGIETRYDNRKSNLRICTHAENMMNVPPKSNLTKSGVPGVYFDHGKWVARISENNNEHYLGRYDNKEDAIAARKEAEEKYFGEYSYDNSMKIAEKIKL